MPEEHAVEISFRVALLDQQVVDRDELPIGRVDDVDLDRPGRADGCPSVVRMWCSQEALGTRLRGLTGGLLARLAERLRDRDQPDGGFSFAPEEIESLDPMIRLRRPLQELPAAPLEKWLAGHVIGKLPGADRAGR